MAKKSLKKNIMEIKKISKYVPSLMETIHFSPEREREMYEDEDEDFDTEINMDEPKMAPSAPMKPKMPQEEAPLEGKEVVDQIRKMALKAMANLADNTEDSYYSVLKKIWQMADKNPEDERNKKAE
jgi:hypothetical protein